MFSTTNILLSFLIISALVKCYELQKELNKIKGNIKHIEDYLKDK